jgi:hypothetical protein
VDYLELILLLSCLNSCFLAALLYQIRQITDLESDIQEFKEELGGVFGMLFEKLSKFEEIMPGIEPPNPLLGIIKQMMENSTPIDRSPAGQFVRAEVIPPSDSENQQ